MDDYYLCIQNEMCSEELLHKKGVTLVVELKKCSTLTSVHLCHSEEKLRECIFLGKNVSISTS